MIGKKLGRYEILAKLGAGGMGEVYRARDLSLGRDVALKLLPEHVRDDPDRLRRFEHEARAASALNHPNIVTIYDIGQSDGTPYIAMELVEGHTLRSLLTLRPFLTKRALALAAQAAEGLARAHGVGIIHRDLKPENLMVTRDGFVKILDFGLAKLHEPDPLLASDAPTEPATRPGVLMGTVGYMSPEQARGRPVDFRSDQFSCGSILYEMATGKRAFERETPVQTLAAIIESEPEPIQNLNPDVPPPFRWIVERCLRKNPEERYASTVDLARELRNVHDRLAEVSSGPRPLPPIRFGRGSWFRPVTLAAFLGVAVAAVATWRPQTLSEQELPQAVAVLPIKNLGGSPDDDVVTVAIADAVLTRLAEIPSVTVVDRSTVREHRSAADDPVKAARAMGASFVVTGGVQRVGDRIGVSVRLVRSDSSVTWAEQYEVDPRELFALQKQIAQDLTSALKLRLSASDKRRLARSPTSNADAYADYAQARSFLERPDLPEAIDRAIEIFQRAIARDPVFSLAHAGLGEAFWEKYLATKDASWTTRASAAILEALRLDPDQPSVRLSLAVVYLGIGKVDAAAHELRQVLAHQPRNDQAHRLLGEALATKGVTDEALVEFRAAVNARPNFWRNHSSLATALLRKARYGEAIAAFTRVTELQPDSSWGYQQLGTAYQLSGDATRALENYHRSNAIKPAARSYTNMGNIFFDQGRYKAAAEAFEEAARLEPTPIKFRNIGEAYERLGRSSEAQQAYTRGIELSHELLRVNPSNARELSTLAVIEAKLKRVDEARRHAAQAAALSPSDGEVLYKQALVHALTGANGQAVVLLGKALDSGYSKALASADENLRPLRARPDYQKLFQ